MSCTIPVSNTKELSLKYGMKEDEVLRYLEKYNSLSEQAKQGLTVTPDQASARWINRVDPQYDGHPVELLEIREDVAWFKDGTGKVTSASVKEVTDAKGVPLDAGMIQSLKSDAEFLMDSVTGFENIGKDIINDPGRMLEIGEEMADLDGRKLSQNHREVLMSSLRMVVDPAKKAIPKISVWLNKEFQRTGGQIVLGENQADLYVGISPSQGSRTALETYVHELYHAATTFILDTKDPETIKGRHRMEVILKAFLENTEVVDLARHVTNTTTAESEARATLDYLAKHGIKEFIPYAMSNEAVMNRLKEMDTLRVKEDTSRRGLTYQIVMWIRKAFNAVLRRLDKEPQGNDLVKMAWLVNQLVKVNNKQLYLKKNKVVDNISSMFDQWDYKAAKLIEKVKEGSAKQDIILSDPNASVFKQYMTHARVLVQGFIDENHRKQAEILMSFWGMKPEGSVQSFFRDMNKPDLYGSNTENLGLKAQEVDRHRENEHNTAVSTLESAFGTELSRVEMEGLMSLILSDAVILGHELEKFVDKEQGEQAIDKAIAEIEKPLENIYGEKLKNYYKGQSMVLAKYLNTGKGDITLLKNAYSIAHRQNDVTRTNYIEEEAVEMIDRLVTLYALKDTDKVLKDAIYDMQIEHPFAMGIFMEYMASIKNDSKELFQGRGDKHMSIKGYHRDIYPVNSESMVAPLVDEERLKKEGFKLIKETVPHRLHSRKVPMGFYVSTMAVRPSLHKAAFRYTAQVHRGFNVKESYGVEGRMAEAEGGDRSVSAIAAERDITKMRTEMARILRERKEGNFASKREDEFIHPALNQKGEISNFVYEMSREDKINLLGIDTNPFEIIGATKGSIVDKLETLHHNKKVVETLLLDAKINAVDDKLIGRNLKEYAFVGPDSKDKELAEFWSLLPREVKEQINWDNPKVQDIDTGAWGRKKPVGFMVRRDMLLNFMGYREMTLSRTTLGKRMSPGVRHGMDVSEAVWKDIIHIAKSNILIKIPAVLLSNVFSNIMLSTLTGTNLQTVVKFQLDGVKELHKYLDDAKVVTQIKVKKSAGTATVRELRLLDMHLARIENSPIKELIDAGFYTQILDETEARDRDSGNRVLDYADSKLQNVPMVVRNGMSLLMLDKRSRYFKVVTQAIQYSDFVARYAQYQIYKRKGMGGTEAINKVRDAFINYYAPNSKLVDWMNQMGLLMFTKYYTRIQRFIAGSITESPLKVFTGLMTLNFLWPEAPNPWESGILTSGPLGRLGDPIDHFLTALTPGTLSVADNISSF